MKNYTILLLILCLNSGTLFSQQNNDSILFNNLSETVSAEWEKIFTVELLKQFDDKQISSEAITIIKDFIDEDLLLLDPERAASLLSRTAEGIELQLRKGFIRSKIILEASRNLHLYRIAELKPLFAENGSRKGVSGGSDGAGNSERRGSLRQSNNNFYETGNHNGNSDTNGNN